jgi:hypothetical protein
MASTDSRPVPIKNTAFRAYFPIYDNTGALVPGAAGLDSEVSKDGGNFADCTNEATEIQSTGLYFLDLTATEMNADAVVVIVKTSTTDAKTTVLVFYPQESGDIKVDVQSWLGTAAATPTVAGVPEVDVTHIAGAARDTNQAQLGVNIVNADTIPWNSSAITSSTIANNAITDAKVASDVTIASVTGAVGSVTTVNDKTGYRLSATGVDDVLDEVVEGTTTLRESMRLANTANGAKTSGAATTTFTARDLADSKNRLSVTVDADGNRSAVTRDLT